jgi:uncharacterized protein
MAKIVPTLLLLCFAVCGGEPLRLQTMSGVIQGTLEVPQSPLPCPVALIICGSGPTDRNGNVPGMSNDSMKLLAESLLSQGVASLRFDKRGIAQSAKAGPKEESLRFETYVDDVIRWGELLRKDSRFSKLIVIGHSEGSLIGMLAARQLNPDSFVSIAGAGMAGDRILLKQLEPKLSASLFAKSKEIIAALKAGRTYDPTPRELDSLFRPSVQPYMISWMKYDPAKEIAALSMPVLLLQGSTDIQVGVDDAKALSAANPKATLAVIDGMNHVLKHVPADQSKQLASYSDSSLPLDSELARRLTDFLSSP